MLPLRSVTGGKFSSILRFWLYVSLAPLVSCMHLQGIIFKSVARELITNYLGKCAVLRDRVRFQNMKELLVIGLGQKMEVFCVCFSAYLQEV